MCPTTFVLPNDGPDLETYFIDQKRTVIVKPEGGSNGKGIFITQSMAEISSDRPAVVQEYVSRPLLLGGRKFDLRIYVAVCGLGAKQRIFVLNDGLARFCTMVTRMAMSCWMLCFSALQPAARKQCIAYIAHRWRCAAGYILIFDA
eukprot:SAG31_NODE_14736_length_790_cov_0.730825_1_plen_146_part_00